MQISNSSATAIIFGNFINSTSNVRTLLVENITYSNSVIDPVIDLINTQNIVSNANVNVIFNNLKFYGIRFTTKGNLLALMHKMTSPITKFKFVNINNSSFTNLTSATIYADSTGSDATGLTMQTKFVDCIFDQINGKFSSLLSTNNGAVLEFTNSTFTNIYTYEEGAVLYAGFEKTSVSFTSCVFQNNSAVQGTIFVIESESFVKCTNCTFVNNFSITNTIFITSLNGYFEFYNSSIYNNYAINNPVGEILDSANLCILSSVAVYGNQALTVSDISTEFIIKCNYLCFVTSNFISYANTNNLLIASTLDTSLVQLILSSLSIQDGSSINNQDILFNIFLSALSISNSQLLNLKSNIQMSSSNLTIENTQITNVTNIAGTDFIFANLDSILTVNSSSFSNSSSSFMNLRSSQVIISNLTLTNVASPSLISQIVSSTKAEMSSINVVNCTASNGIFFDFETSSNLSLSGFAGSQADICFVKILNSNVTQIDSFAINRVLQPLVVKSSVINMISNSNFTNSGSSALKAGGAISMSDSKISVTNSRFLNNKAISGGAISFECTSIVSCYLIINTTTFSSNYATSQGGAIYYSFNRPIVIKTTFINNTADYGPDFASYAIRIVMNGNSSAQMAFDNIASGVQYDQEVKLSLVDYDDQTMSLISIKQITINPVNKTVVSMKGTNSGLLRNGVATFNNLIFNTQPGSTNIQFIASSKAIDSIKVKEVYGSVSSNLISVNFRFCKPGEIQLSDNTCSTCASGTFSLDWNSTECQPCPSNAQCLGGNQISVSAGYWRMSQNTSTIVECIYDKACDGGYVDQEDVSVNCATGYTGILCSECQIINGTKYSKVSDFECSKCPNPILNAIQVIGLIILVFAFIFLIIIVNIRKTKESQFSILLRILTNYLQLISSMMSFSFKFPATVSNAFNPISNIGATSNVFLSFDCFVTDLEIKGPFPSNEIFKVVLTGILPLTLLIAFIVIWMIVRFTYNSFTPDFKRNIVISFISVVFLLYPRLVQSTFNMFGCVLIDANDNRSKINLQDKCYGENHIKWVLIIALPIIVVWIISMPAIALYLLYKNIHKDDDNKVKQYFLILYQGLRSKAYYWEFVNTLRKVLILLLFNIMYFFSQPIKILLCSLLLVASIRMQNYIKPYKVEMNNTIELRAIIASIFTITSGIIFIQAYQFAMFNLCVYFLIFAVNLWFITEWIYMVLVCTQSKWFIVKALIKILEFVTFKDMEIFRNIYLSLFKQSDQNPRGVRNKRKNKKPKNARRKQ